MKTKKILAIGNLFPLPWEPHRGSFNRQQFERLEQEHQVEYIIPVAFTEWFKHKSEVKSNKESNKHYVPYFFTPKIGRAFYSYWMLLSLLFPVKKVIKRFDPDLIFVSWAFPEGVAVAKLARIFKLPFILKVHGTDINDFIDLPGRGKQIVKACNQASTILSVSQALCDKMVEAGVAKEKIVVNYNGVNKNLFFNDESVNTNTKPLLLYVGNLKRTKGVLACAEAFGEIINQGIDAELCFIGQGTDKVHIEKILAENPKAKELTHFLPPMPQEEIRSWMNKAHLLLLPSFNEGVPNVVLEAKACGLPSIATAVGGIPEILCEGEGLLVPLHDTQALISAIRTGLESNWNRKAVAEGAQRFTWEENIANVNAAIDKAIN
ncbi:glycosyltransferase [Teredinibacter sp. KSP-S5-2]|uniref:glycosyltransferase n=1 Tax=Teredinibacter sp. KSP-S5-2 TaxID=3034506 RepID=UPI0029351725|nr:glycosyltransferase [Teredinibacter sp. KSP-S5-2]WNO09047.1 glycosyltransferase [Teredinibacter sp. KSP-S5-2]